MVNTSDAPITVDGVRLDTLAWNITEVSQTVAGRRGADVEVAGADGSIPSLNDTLEPAVLGLEMWLRGTDADGAVPGAGQRATYQANLDELVHLFGVRHRLVEVTKTQSAGQVRRALAKVTDTIQPKATNATMTAATFSVAMVIPAGCWEDLTATDWTSGLVAPGIAFEVVSLQGATERNQDAVVLVQGPANNPRLTDPATGSYVQLNQVLAAGQFWRINLATWASRMGTTLTLASADTVGTDVTATTVYGGAQSVATYLTLQPARTAADPVRRTQLVMTAGGGMTTATRVSLRARRKFAL